MKKAVFLLLTFICIFISQIYPQWIQSNGPKGGSASCIAAGPDAAGGTRIFTGTENGIYLSTDNGLSWSPINSGLPDGRWVTALSVNGNNIFAGTHNSGICFSADNGNNWVEAALGLPKDPWGYLEITTIALCGTNIFAGTFERGVYLSTNNGKTWTAVNSGLPENPEIQDLTVMGTNIFAVANRYVYLSTDNGASWSAVNSGLPENESIQALTASRTNLFAGTTYNGIYMLADSGSVWNKVSSGLQKDSLGYTFIYTLASNGTNIFAGTENGPYLSSDNGSNWNNISSSLMEDPLVYDLAVTGNNVYAVALRDLYFSSDNGANWYTSDSGPIETDIRSLAVNGTNIFASDRMGVYLSTDNGADWHAINSGIPKEYLSIECLSAGDTNTYLGGNYSIQGSPGIHVILSFYNGTAWTDISSALPEHSVVKTIEISAGKIFAGIFYDGADTSVVLVSTNNGISWTNDYSGLPFVNDLAVIGKNIFAGTRDGVYLSDNNGKSWTKVSSGLPKNENAEITALAVCDSLLAASTIRGRVYFSSNNGASWIASAPELSAINSLAVSGNYIFAANEKGRVFLTTDYGKTCTEVSPGLPASNENFYIGALAVNKTHIFAATGAGVWVRSLSEFTDVKDKVTALSSAKFLLEQNYPNPFNPVTTISCTLPADCKVKLSVYNLLGEEIRVLADETLKVGTYKVTLNAEGLPSGVYFYQLKAANYIETKKMILLR